MVPSILTMALGALMIVIGAVNMTGNISSLHSYHRHRVREEDKKPYGRAVGIGMLVIGLSVIVFGALVLAFEKTQNDALVLVGTGVMIAGMIVGSVLIFRAMMKYNKGIF